jgi:hypothetical protein
VGGRNILHEAEGAGSAAGETEVAVGVGGDVATAVWSHLGFFNLMHTSRTVTAILQKDFSIRFFGKHTRRKRKRWRRRGS